MKNVMIRNGFILLAISLLVGWNSLSAQNTDDNGRYKLAIYATGSQNGQPLEPDLLGMAQNRVITKLTNEGNYRMIERSDAFLKQIQNEQVMQQSGEVAEEQMVEIGKSYGADKICVVSITILDKYKSLYIATRIVDVETKTSYESGDAQVYKFKLKSNSMQVLRKTLEEALNKMLAVSSKKNIAPTTPTKPVETPKNAKTTSDIPTQPERSDVSSQQSSNLTVAEVRAEKERAKVLAKAEATNAKAEFKAYKDRVIKEKGGFLEVNSLAYKEYQKWKKNVILGPIFIISALPSYGYWGLCDIIFDDVRVILPLSIGVPVALFTTGIVLCSTAKKHLQKSYQYYINGDQKTATLNFHPYIGGNQTFGAGLTLRF